MTAGKFKFPILVLLIFCLGIGLFISSKSFFTQEDSEPERTQEEFGHLSLDKKLAGDCVGAHCVPPSRWLVLTSLQ